MTKTSDEHERGGLRNGRINKEKENKKGQGKETKEKRKGKK